MISKIDFTIGIPVYNGRKDIEALVRSIRDDLAGLDYEVIVVEDGKSTDLCREVVEKYLPTQRGGSAAQYIYDPDCFGIAQATEKIITAMRGRYLLRLDADTIVNREAVEKMRQYMDNHPDVGVLAPKLVNLDGSFQPSYETHFKEPIEWFWDYALWIKKFVAKIRNSKFEIRKKASGDSALPKIKSAFEEPIPVAYMASAAVMIRREAIDQVGGIDPEMEFFMEDADWIIRIGAHKASRKGRALLYWPAVSIVHIGGQSGQLYIHCRDRSLKNLYYFYRKHRPGAVNQLVLTTAVLSGSLLSLVLALAVFPFSILNSQLSIISSRALRSFFNVFRWHIIKLLKL